MKLSAFQKKRIQQIILAGWFPIAVIAMLVVVYFYPPKVSADWAAWVQAIGIIGSISIAISVVQLQNEHQIEAEKRAQAIRQRGFLAIAQFAFDAAEETAALFAGDRIPDPAIVVQNFDAPRLKAAQEGLAQINVVDLGTFERMNAFFRFGRSVAIIGFYAEQVTKLDESIHRDSPSGRAALQFVKKARMEATLAIGQIKRMSAD